APCRLTAACVNREVPFSVEIEQRYLRPAVDVHHSQWKRGTLVCLGFSGGNTGGSPGSGGVGETGGGEPGTGGDAGSAVDSDAGLEAGTQDAEATSDATNIGDVRMEGGGSPKEGDPCNPGNDPCMDGLRCCPNCDVSSINSYVCTATTPNGCPYCY